VCTHAYIIRRCGQDAYIAAAERRRGDHCLFRNSWKLILDKWQMSVKFLFPLATVTVIKLSSQLNRCIATVTTSIGYLPSRRASPAFGWYSFYRPTQGRRLSRPVISIFISKALKTTRVNEGSHSFTCHPHVYPRME